MKLFGNSHSKDGRGSGSGNIWNDSLPDESELEPESFTEEPDYGDFADDSEELSDEAESGEFTEEADAPDDEAEPGDLAEESEILAEETDPGEFSEDTEPEEFAEESETGDLTEDTESEESAEEPEEFPSESEPESDWLPEDLDSDFEDESDDEGAEFEDMEDADDWDEDDEEEEDSGGASVSRFSLANWKIITIAAVCAFVIVFAALALVVNYFLDLINYQEADSDYFVTVSTEEELPEESPINSKLAAIDEEEAAESLEATEEELTQWNQELEDITSDSDTYEIPISEDVYNILLIGSDTRERGGAGRSDAMILMSINQKTETIYLTSFLRDSYVHIPGYGNTRLNHSFAYGGPELLEETLEENFKVHVDRYVAVDFYSFMDVIDILGGVYIDVTEEELDVTNDYVWSMNKLLGEEWYTDYIWNPGYQLLNGKQALCYARNRYTGTDFERTQRQRNIISTVISKCKSSAPSTLVSLAQVILPQITTDMEKSQILNYAANIGAYINYDVISQQIPAAGTYSNVTISGMSVIRIDMDANIDLLQSTIYAGTEYDSSVSEEVE